MAERRIPSLISTAWLHAQKRNTVSKIKILDSSWTAKKTGYEDYVEKHIPGAAFFDLNKCVRPTQLIPRNIPDPDCFTEYVSSSLGVNNDDHLVVYDRGNIFSSCRAWWTFMAYGHKYVSVLDGGLKKWVYENLPTDSGKPISITECGDFIARPSERWIVDYNKVMKMLTTGEGQLVDARSSANFDGTEDEPSSSTQAALSGVNLPIPDTMHRGHIKSARSLPFGELFDPDKKDDYLTFVDKARLQKVLRDAGIDLNQPLVSMCYAGNAANAITLVAHMLGSNQVGTYYGSWTEWGQRADKSTVQSKRRTPG